MARVEADHIFIFVAPGGMAEAAALRAVGFQVDTGTTRHEGGGTASRSAIFKNFYLELLWVDSTVSVSDASRAAHAAMQRAAGWRATGVSPFGVGLRKLDGPDEYGVPATPLTEAWMREGTAIMDLDQPDEAAAFKVFVVPSYMALPSWIEYAGDATRHPNGSERVSAIAISGPASHHPRVLRTLSVPHLLVEASPEPLLEIEFDGGRAGQRHDLRPLLPLVVRR